MSTDIGRFSVAADPSEVAAFRTALPHDELGEGVPLTFPIRWLVGPEVRAALIAMVPEPDLVLVHESQAFDYERPLIVGGRYELALAARREATPDRLVVDGTLHDADGTPVATIETVLRLFSTKAQAA